MKLSIVDLGTVAPDTTESGALTDALDAAVDAEAFGYHRIWFAEHHQSRSGASHHPELLIAAATQRTSRIRLGSGAVLMNHYSPYKVAEMYQQLEAMAPGRIDLGMGRATGGPVVDLAMQLDRQNPVRLDHSQQVLETLAWLYGAFPDEHPFKDNPLMPSVDSRPEAWLLGSSPHSGRLAAQLGIGYTFAGFINPTSAAEALTSYRQGFQPAGFGWDAPAAILAVNVAVGETDEEGRRIAASPKGYYSRLGRAGRAAGSVMVPTPDEALGEMSGDERDEPVGIVDGQWPRFVAGSPSTVRLTLERMATEAGLTGDDEIMVQDLIADSVDRRRSRELLAEEFGLHG
ncbi:MsnO8 family LLM class oxidoreductase [Candidatus Corynebacterium faecigallinarum]|uniref:MsnO8 family LLM class oxidoreductase n=1 Tax=Candidatus Corynebacterium faecigallinarum TaxID=2838528 RepID=UPI003FD2BBF8